MTITDHFTSKQFYKLQMPVFNCVGLLVGLVVPGEEKPLKWTGLGPSGVGHCNCLRSSGMTYCTVRTVRNPEESAVLICQNLVATSKHIFSGLDKTDNFFLL